MFLERRVIWKGAVDELVDVDVVLKQVRVKRRDQQLETVASEVALRVTLFCTRVTSNNWSKNVDERQHCRRVTPRVAEWIRPTLTPHNTWFTELT